MTGRRADTTGYRTSAARRLLAAFAVLAAVATAAAPTASAAPLEAPDCRYVVAAPPGVGGNYLLIERNESLGLRRVGEEVGVFKLHGAGPRVECEGRPATVDDIDRILFRPPGAGHQLTIEESAGPFAPGATPEPGGDEIEIYARFPKRHPSPDHLTFPSVRVIGTAGPDQMRIGRVGRDRTGINLDPAADGAHPDADVIAYSVSPAHYTLDALQGNDRLDSSGTAPEFDGPLPEGSVTLDGGPGDDLILGGPRRDIVRAGPGDDTIYTRGGDDVIDPGTGVDHAYAGPGDDRISTGGGREEGGFDLYSGEAGDDSIEAVDNERERILCGPGFDHVAVDELDEWQSPECERAHGPGAP
jgi:RTX calcium-binding nonapeptide repeat (4 copies)